MYSWIFHSNRLKLNICLMNGLLSLFFFSVINSTLAPLSSLLLSSFHLSSWRPWGGCRRTRTHGVSERRWSIISVKVNICSLRWHSSDSKHFSFSCVWPQRHISALKRTTTDSDTGRFTGDIGLKSRGQFVSCDLSPHSFSGMCVSLYVRVHIHASTFCTKMLW